MSTGAGVRTGSSQDDSASASTGRRLPRIRFFSSIRFRLTAWYVFVLIIILSLLGVLLSAFLGQALENEVDNRLHSAQLQAGQPDITRDSNNNLVVAGEWDGWVEKVEDNAELRSLVTSGLFFLVTNLDGSDFRELGAVPDGLLPAVNLDQLTPDQMILRTISTDGQRIRVLTRPIVLQSASELGLEPRVIGAIIVGESLERQEGVVEVVNQLLRTAGAAGVLLATWGGWLLAGRALAPVNKISSTADEIARQGDAQESLSTRLEVNHTGDELARLAITFNAMLERIERAFRGQRRFVADASHELRTPLTAIQGNVDVLYRLARSGRQLQTDDLQDALGDMKRESARMARLIDDLLLLARTDAEGLGHMVRPEPVSLDVVAREAFRTAESIAKGQRLHLTIRQPLMIYGDGDRLVQVMIILLDNALRHTPAGGTVDLIIDAAETDDGSMTCARIQVVDSGEGIPPEHLPHLFERFYRVEGSRSRLAGGSGLGLAIALAIVRGHNGWIGVASPEGKGTHMSVWLPILESPGGDSEAMPVLPVPHDDPQLPDA